MDGIKMKSEFGQSSVVSPEHPPVTKMKKTGADDGVYPRGLVLCEKDNAGSPIAVPYEDVADQAMTGTINGTNKDFTLDGDGPIEPGTVVVANDNTSAQELTDNGHGVLSGDGSGTVNYETGDISVTFETAPAEGKTVVESHTRRVIGIGKYDVDTAKDDAEMMLVHGIAVRNAVVIDKDGTPVTTTVEAFLEKRGIWLQ